jgi:hypothetical protein
MSPKERVEVLKTAAPNSWLALSCDESRVVARGDSYSEAARMAAESGEKDPVLLKTPDSWVPLVR